MKFIFAILWAIFIVFCDRHSEKVPNEYKYEFGYWIGAISMGLLHIVF